MKKIILTVALIAGLTASAQVKVGTNPTTIATNAAGTSDDAVFQVEGSAITNQFVVLQNGNVGIGTTAPNETLEIKTSTAGGFPGLKVTDYTDTSGVRIQSVSGGSYRGISGDSYYFSSNLYRSTNTTSAMINLFGGNVKFTTNSGLTAGNDFTPTERMRITETGNVGIGTTAPTNKLTIQNDVVAPTNLEPTALKLYNGNDGGSGIEFSNAALGKSKISFGVTSSGGGTDDTYLGFSTGTNTTIQERMRITETGNVGIGTTAPTEPLTITKLNGATGATSILLKSNGAASGDLLGELRFGNVGNTSINASIGALRGTTVFGDGSLVFKTSPDDLGPQTRMIINQNGNVGIGTTTPFAKLHISGKIISGNDTSVQGSSLLEANYNQTAISDNTTAVIGTSYSSGGITINYGVRNSKTAGNEFTSSTSIASVRVASVSDSAFRIFTAPSQTVAIGGAITNMTEKFIVTNTGNVGIGTTAPAAKLQIQANANNESIFNIYSTANNTGDAVKFANVDLGGQGFGGSYLQWDRTSSLGNNFSIYTRTNGGVSSQRMIVTSDGNVGIGTTAPSSSLHVNSAANNDFAAKIIQSGGLFSGQGGLYLQTNSTGVNSFQVVNSGTTTMIVKGSGNVGIGTTAPTSKLSVVGLPVISVQATPGTPTAGYSLGDLYHSGDGVIRIMF